MCNMKVYIFVYGMPELVRSLKLLGPEQTEDVRWDGLCASELSWTRLQVVEPSLSCVVPSHVTILALPPLWTFH